MTQKQTSGNDPLETRPPVERLAWLRSLANRHWRYLPWLLGFYFYWMVWYWLTTVYPVLGGSMRNSVWVQVIVTAGLWGGLGLMVFAYAAARRELKAALRASGHRLCPHCGFTPGEIVLPAPCPECGHALGANIEEQWGAYEENRKKILGRRPIEKIFSVP